MIAAIKIISITFFTPTPWVLKKLQHFFSPQGKNLGTSAIMSQCLIFLTH